MTCNEGKHGAAAMGSLEYAWLTRWQCPSADADLVIGMNVKVFGEAGPEAETAPYRIHGAVCRHRTMPPTYCLP